MSHSGGTILVTGANGSLGCAIVSRIVSTPASRACHGLYTVRNAMSDASALDDALRRSLPSSSTGLLHSYRKMCIDLSCQSSVRDAANDINKAVAAGELPPLRAIILNAGHQEFETQTWTDDGLDTTFAVNYLNQFLLVMLLLRSIDKERGRVVWITSWSHNRHHRFQPFVGAYRQERYNTMVSGSLEPLATGTWSANKDDNSSWAAGYRRYSASKMCIVAFVHELQARLERNVHLNKVSVLAVDPGIMATNIVRLSDSWLIRVLMFKVLVPALVTLWSFCFPRGIFRTLERSATDVMTAALSCSPPPLSEHPKALYLDGAELGEDSTDARDPDIRSVLWADSVAYTRLKNDECILELN